MAVVLVVLMVQIDMALFTVMVTMVLTVVVIMRH